MHVLVVEDDDDSRELVGTLLTSAGASVTLAGDARQATHALSSQHFDVMVCDVGMPGEDGVAFLRRVRKLPAPSGIIPAVALTAFSSPNDIHNADDAGFTAYMTKPVDGDALVSVILALKPRAAS